MNWRVVIGLAVIMCAATMGDGKTINVRAEPYLAKGDGKADDTRAVQAALSDANAGDTVAGLGKFGIRRGVMLRGKSRVTIKLDLVELGPCPEGTLIIDNCTEVTVVESRIENGDIKVRNSKDCRIVRCTIIAPPRMAAVFGESNVSNQYIGNLIEGAPGESRGLWLGNYRVPEHNALVEGNTVRKMNATGIVIMGTGGKVIGNTVEDSRLTGVVIAAHGGQTGGETTVTGNVFRRLGGHGVQSDVIEGQNPTDNVAVVGNVFTECNSGVYAIHAKNWTISGNQFFRNQHDAIQVGGITSGIVITGNRINDNPDGIQILGNGPTSNITITGNDVSDNKRWGIRVDCDKLTGLLIDGNTVTRCWRGIQIIMEKAAHVVIGDNLTYENTGGDVVK